MWTSSDRLWNVTRVSLSVLGSPRLVSSTLSGVCSLSFSHNATWAAFLCAARGEELSAAPLQEQRPCRSGADNTPTDMSSRTSSGTSDWSVRLPTGVICVVTRLSFHLWAPELKNNKRRPTSFGGNNMNQSVRWSDMKGGASLWRCCRIHSQNISTICIRCDHQRPFVKCGTVIYYLFICPWILP